MTKRYKKEVPQLDLELSDNIIEPLILNQCINGSRIINLLFDNFDSRIFENQRIKSIISVFRNYYMKYHKIPVDQLQEILIKNVAKKTNQSEAQLISDWQVAKNIDLNTEQSYIEDSILDFIKGKQTYLTIMDNLDKIKVNKDISSCMKKFNDIISLSLDGSIGFDYFINLSKHFEDLSNPESRVPTGITELDKAFNGGIPQSGKCLLVFMGQTNIGKSLILSNIAVNFLQRDKFVVVFSMEMCEEMYSTRISAHISQDNINNLVNTIDSTKGKIEKFSDQHPNAKLIVKEFPPKSVTVLTLKNAVEKIINKYNRKPDVILVDYINILNPVDKSAWGNSYDKVGAVTVELRAMSYAVEAPVISVTQSNRGGYNNSALNLDSVSDSLQIATTADAMVALFQQEGDREENRLNASVIKSRFGQVGHTFPLNIDYRSLRITDYTETYADNEDEETFGDDLNNLIN